MAATKKDAIALLENVIRPTLNALNLWSPAAEELLLGTAIVESDLTWRRQRPRGPGRSLWQIEADTHNCWVSCDYIPKRSWPLFKGLSLIKSLIELKQESKPS